MGVVETESERLDSILILTIALTNAIHSRLTLLNPTFSFSCLSPAPPDADVLTFAWTLASLSSLRLC